MGAVIIPAMVIVVAIAGVIYFNCKDKKRHSQGLQFNKKK